MGGRSQDVTCRRMLRSRNATRYLADARQCSITTHIQYIVTQHTKEQIQVLRAVVIQAT